MEEKKQRRGIRLPNTQRLEQNPFKKPPKKPLFLLLKVEKLHILIFPQRHLRLNDYLGQSLNDIIQLAIPKSLSLNLFEHLHSGELNQTTPNLRPTLLM